MDQILHILDKPNQRHTFLQQYNNIKSSNKSKIIDDSIQPWNQRSIQLRIQEQQTPKLFKNKKLQNKLTTKTNRSLTKTVQRQPVYHAQTQSNPNRLKWTLQAEFMSKRKKKFSNYLKQKHYRHMRSNTINPQDLSQSSISKKQTHNFIQIYSKQYKKKSIISNIKIPATSKYQNKKNTKIYTYCPSVVRFQENTTNNIRSSRQRYVGYNTNIKSPIDQKKIKMKLKFNNTKIMQKQKLKTKHYQTFQSLTITNYRKK